MSVVSIRIHKNNFFCFYCFLAILLYIFFSFLIILILHFPELSAGHDKPPYLVVDVFLIRDVLNDGFRRVQFFRVAVGNLEAELIFHCHDDFNVIERV